ATGDPACGSVYHHEIEGVGARLGLFQPRLEAGPASRRIFAQPPEAGVRVLRRRGLEQPVAVPRRVQRLQPHETALQRLAAGPLTWWPAREIDFHGMSSD